MNPIPFITTDASLFQKTLQLLKAENLLDCEILQIRDPLEALEYLGTEMPELIFIDFSDPKIDGFKMAKNIMADPWLLYGGFIAFCANYKIVKRLDELRGANVIATLTTADLEGHLSQVIEIINNNRRILFQRGIGSDLVNNISGSFNINNDPIEASCYANLIGNFLYNAHKISLEEKNNLHFALIELLMNAIEHGNCGISYQQKSEWLEKGGIISDLIKEKCKDPMRAGTKVTFEYSIGPQCARFLIRDEGEGFDWRKVKDVTQDENLLELHGRGILLSRTFTDNLCYNEKGNEVTFEIRYDQPAHSMVPRLFDNIDPVEIRPGDIIFRQGEPGNYLYYIVKGEYEVLVNGKAVSSLSPEDVFMGVMSFLLYNERSATVRAISEGKLIKVSKKQFVNAMKKRPHYAFFLCRLLAQRIHRSNLELARQQVPAVIPEWRLGE